MVNYELVPIQRVELYKQICNLAYFLMSAHNKLCIFWSCTDYAIETIYK